MIVRVLLALVGVAMLTDGVAPGLNLLNLPTWLVFGVGAALLVGAVAVEAHRWL